MDKKKVVVIGAGFGGLGSAILLARAGYDVTVVEKNDKVGGRANLLELDGYRWDMGPSWYLMPDAFDRYFTAIGRKVEDYLDLQKLEPSYRVFFKPSSSSGGGTTKEPVSRNGYNTLDSSASLHSASEGQAKYLDLYADVDKAVTIFEGIEPHSGDKLRAYLKSAAYQYSIAMEKFVFKNFDSIWDFMTPQLAIEGLQLNVFTKLYNYVSRFVKNENLKKLLMYPSVFLGTSPYETPALFNIMSHVDFNQGVFYPQGGIHEIPKALYQIALEEGVKFEFNAEVEKIMVEEGKVTGVKLHSQDASLRDMNKSISIDDGGDIEQKAVLLRRAWGDISDPDLESWKDRRIELCHLKDSIACLLTIDNLYHGFMMGYGYDSNKDYIERNMGSDMLCAKLQSYGDISIDNIHWIQGFYIDSEYRKLGLGSKILAEYEKNANEQGYKAILLDVDISKEGLIKRYKNHGYDEIMHYTWSHPSDQTNQKEKILMFKNNISSHLISADIIISNADMRHTETQLLEVLQQTYPESYWAKQVISPSGFILYLGVDGELPQLKHHTLVFSDDWRGGFDQIFKDPQRPQDPNYYICNPSKTDPSVAPAGKENLFVLVPIAPGLDSTPESLEAYRDHIIADIAHNCGIPDLQDRIEVSQIFSIPQFEQYYNAYKGTALGLAHTFFQSAVRRPQNYSKKVKGLYYAGGYTTPGIGMPMCLISAMMVADRVEKNK